jgi:hypothetical protein
MLLNDNSIILALSLKTTSVMWSGLSSICSVVQTVLQETIPDLSTEPNRQAHTHSKESCLVNLRQHRWLGQSTPNDSKSALSHDRHNRKSNPAIHEALAL